MATKKKRKQAPPIPESSFNGSSYSVFASGKRDLTDYDALLEQTRARQQMATAGTAPMVGGAMPGAAGVAAGGVTGVMPSGELDPRQFGEVAPVEGRPEVLPLEEEIPEQNKDNSVLGTFFDVMDNIVPDDLGGMIRGTSGWLAEVPLYQETIGAALGVPLQIGAGAMDVLNWGSDQMNHLGAALFSALPGGIDILSWDEAQDISFGQVVTANAAINQKMGTGNWLINAGGVASLNPFAFIGTLTAMGEQQDPDNILYSEQFNILDPEIRKEAFESGGMGQITSGFADSVWTVVADPLIVAGPASSVIRYGTKGGKFAGLTNKALNNAAQIDRVGEGVINQGDLIAKLGIDGARASGRLTADGEYLIAAMEGKADELFTHVYVQNSSNKRVVQSLLGDTSPDRPEEAASLASALMGYAPGWERLRTLNADMYEAAAMGLGVNPYAPVGSSLDDFATAGIRLTDEQRALADDVVYERLSERQDLVKDLAATGQIVQRAGAAVGPRTVRAKNAWRAGAARQEFARRPSGAALASTDRPGQGHFVYDTIYGISGSAPMRVVRWLGQGTPNGVIQLKDGANAADSLDEFAAWMRKSPMDADTSRQFFNEFAQARTVAERKAILLAAETRMLDDIVAASGGKMTVEEARNAYRGYNARRAAVLEEAHKTENTFAIDPDTGEKVLLPGFYAELDQAFPLLDVKEFTRVVKNNNISFALGEVGDAANYANSLWKISVLARLGYTQRNIAEGALRSLAVLGVLAMHPSALLNLPSNAKHAARVRRGMKRVKSEEKLLADAQKELADLRVTLRGLEKEDAALFGNVTARLDEMRQLGLKESDYIRKIDELSASIDESLKAVRLAESQRKRVGRRSNIMYDGTAMQGAFQGQEGALALKASSADVTTYLTFDNVVAKRYDRLSMSPEFRVLDPAKLTPKQMADYWAEFAIRINFRYKSDPLGRLILADVPVDDIFRQMRRTENQGYIKQMSRATGRDLDTDQGLRSYIDEQIARMNNEVPQGSGLRAKLLADEEITPADVSASFAGRDLPVIPGRLDDGILTKGVLKRTKELTDKTTAGLMRWLGTIPEDKLLRHPFYDAVYRREQERLYRLAAERGADMTSNIVLNRINKASHQIALKSTRQTMYTIDRLSNAAVMLRFISPFFPAWENSIRTWGRIAWTNPAVVGAGNILWNIPNNLGMVVNENGEPVESSSFLRDEGNYIVWPKAVTDFLNDKLGPLGPGEQIMTRQSAANVIFPGSNWLFPGVGLPATIPTALFLRGKPEDAELLKNAVGEEMFREIAPMGQVQGDLADIVLPTFGRRIKQWLSGESSETAYLNTWNTIIEDAYITAQLEDRPLTKKEMEKVADRANRFWGWQIGAAVVAPFQSAFRSEYQVQRDLWNKLLDDSSLSYQQKIKTFVESFNNLEFDDPLYGKGEAFLAITRTGSYNETKLQPNLTTWARIVKNKDVVDELYAINPELVGMFGNMGSFDDPFSYAVYGEYGTMRIGPNGNKIRRKLRPSEIARNNEIADGWTAYWKVRDAVEEKAIQLGYSSLQVDDAKPLRDIIDKAKADLSERFPAWGQEQTVYENNFSQFLLGARKIVENQELMNEDSTVQMLAAYLDVRDEIARRLDGEKDQAVRKQLRQIGYAAAFRMRQMDIGFADFYDQYLDKDDFRRV